MADKAAGAYRTIGELSQEIGVRQHILRYWETRFPQLRPLQRAGGRRYYRPDDVALVRRIHSLLERDGYTIRGVQALLNKERGRAPAVSPDPVPMPASAQHSAPSVDLSVLKALRDDLAAALTATAPSAR